MARTCLFLKVEVEHDEHETAEQLAGEICRRLLKVHGVRLAELSSSYSVAQTEGEPGPPATSS
jgi:hypothetical protein